MKTFSLQEVLTIIEAVTEKYYPLNCEYTPIQEYKYDLEQRFLSLAPQQEEAAA